MLQPIFSILIVLGLFALLNVYINFSLIKPLQLTKKYKIITWVIFITFIALILSGTVVMGIIRAHFLTTNDFERLQFTSYILLGFASFILVFTVIKDLMVLATKWTIVLIKKETIKTKLPKISISLPNYSQVTISKISTAAVLILSLIFVTVGYFNSRTMTVRQIQIPIHRLPLSLVGTKIAMISDLHTGIDYKKKYVEQIVAEVNKLSPDIFAIVGDIADGFPVDLLDELAPLTKIKATYGKFYVTGNHEYYWNGAEWILALKALGYKTLINEHVVIQKGMAALVVGGIPDIHAEQFYPNQKINLRKTFQNAPSDPNSFKILLAHQPRYADLAAVAGVNLQLSGHTHSGQFFPWNLVVRLVQPYVNGLYTIGNMLLFVSEGVAGWGPPLRLGTQNEILLFILEAI